MVELHGKRYCYWVPESQDPAEHGGYVPAVVIANEAGYYSLKGDSKQFQTPWVWGKTLKQAQKIAQERNEAMGLSELEVAEIILSSMKAGPPVVRQ